MQIAGENETLVTEFVLTGCTGPPNSKMEIVTILLIAYSVVVFGNGLIVLVIICDPRLHIPMYFFLCNLSIVDLCYTTTGIPQSIANCLADRPVMTFTSCAIQMIMSTFFPITECLLLVVMAYDRFVAISSPLHYVFIMNRTVCLLLAIITWASAFVLTVAPCVSLPARFCGNNEVDHLVCEFKAVFKLLCQDDDYYQIGIYLACILVLILPLSFILFSYVRIVGTILKMHSEGNRMKAFSTCGSHLAVVTIFFGTAGFAYLLPQSKEIQLHDKIVSAVYALLTPMLNPLIYTLRNKDILDAVKRLVNKKGDA